MHRGPPGLAPGNPSSSPTGAQMPAGPSCLSQTALTTHPGEVWALRDFPFLDCPTHFLTPCLLEGQGHAFTSCCWGQGSGVRGAGCGIKALRPLGVVWKNTDTWAPKAAGLNQTPERRPGNWIRNDLRSGTVSQHKTMLGGVPRGLGNSPPKMNNPSLPPVTFRGSGKLRDRGTTRQIQNADSPQATGWTLQKARVIFLKVCVCWVGEACFR